MGTIICLSKTKDRKKLILKPVNFINDDKLWMKYVLRKTNLIIWVCLISSNPKEICAMAFSHFSWAIWNQTDQTKSKSEKVHWIKKRISFRFDCVADINLALISFDFKIIGYIHVSNMNVTLGRKVREHQWVDLVKHYWAILLVIFVAALIIVLMPIVG